MTIYSEFFVCNEQRASPEDIPLACHALDWMFLGRCLLKLAPIARQPLERLVRVSLTYFATSCFKRHWWALRLCKRTTKGNMGHFSYSCVQTEYFRSAFFSPADLLREHLCAHHSHFPTSPPFHPQSLPNAASLSPFLWPSTKELLSLGYWLPSRRLSAHLPPRFPSLTHSQVLVQVGRKTSCYNFLAQPHWNSRLPFFLVLKCSGLWESPLVVLLDNRVIHLLQDTFFHSYLSFIWGQA